MTQIKNRGNSGQSNLNSEYPQEKRKIWLCINKATINGWMVKWLDIQCVNCDSPNIYLFIYSIQVIQVICSGWSDKSFAHRVLWQSIHGIWFAVWFWVSSLLSFVWKRRRFFPNTFEKSLLKTHKQTDCVCELAKFLHLFIWALERLRFRQAQQFVGHGSGSFSSYLHSRT